MATVAAIDWKPIAHKLPIGKDAASKEKRAELFMRFDPNGNGYLSLAEVDKGVRDVLEIDELFDCKPAIMRAFQASKAYDKNCTAELGEDFITRSEFRVLLVYLRCYFELFQLFDAYDTNKDRRISMSEFKRLAKVNHILANWGMQITDPDTEFKKIDKNGGGFILFDEFSEWALKRKMEVETYDD